MNELTLQTKETVVELTQQRSTELSFVGRPELVVDLDIDGLLELVLLQSPELSLEIQLPPQIVIEFSPLTPSVVGGGLSPVPDGTYITGLGVTQDGTVTFVGGIITAVQPAIA